MNNSASLRIAILGDGGWGTAMASVLLDKGHHVTMWGHDAVYLNEMRDTGENRKFLPRFPLPEDLRFQSDLRSAVEGSDLVIVAIPTVYLRDTLQHCETLFEPRQAVVSLTKGIEQHSLKRPSEIIAYQTNAARIAVLSGPSHAEEVARRLPSAVTVAARDENVARYVQNALMTPSFRIYRSTDVTGVELGGALKNVIAIAAGICTGLGLGDNTLAALLTRGLAEMSRLGVRMGSDPHTFAGLSGLGDLITTCVSPHGRNRMVGLALGEGRTIEDITNSTEMVAEGVHTAVSAYKLAQEYEVEMPIVEEVYKILYEEKLPSDAVRDLMAREGKAE